MAADSTTIAVSRETAARLGALKIPGLTYDDVINFALDNVPPAQLQKLYSDWQKDALAKLMANPRVAEANAQVSASDIGAWSGKSSSSPGSLRTPKASKAQASRRPSSAQTRKRSSAASKARGSKSS